MRGGSPAAETDHVWAAAAHISPLCKVAGPPMINSTGVPIGGWARVIKSSSRRWSTRPLPTSQAPGSIFMPCRSWRERLLLPLIAPAPARCSCAAAGTGPAKHLGRRLTGPPAASHAGLDEGLPRCFVSHGSFVRRRGDTERQGTWVELPATLISRPEERRGARR